MNITLSWDLFIIVFFVIIVAYSLIIGRDSTLKVILGTYVAMIAADALGFIFQHYMGGSGLFQGILQLASVSNDQEAVVFVKIIAFVALVILYAVKGSFHVESFNERSGVIRVIIGSTYAILSAGLIVSAILIFVSGGSFISAGITGSQTTLNMLANNSNLIDTIVSNSHLWFSIPALAFLLDSFLGSSKQ
ncbi:hypothetical protein CVV38_01420 [Candidatus Peregrinibacteria bacterium HGW-Peregrinibacteria-1]|jgi:hypothetical protein|nr:MAG: hypothetical protein CVV38_01420 [Candidatus Peregrinibacteria bacterium HGW-Peregrinibacteria-1]